MQPAYTTVWQLRLALARGSGSGQPPSFRGWSESWCPWQLTVSRGGDEGRGRAGRRRAHVVAHRLQQPGELLDVVGESGSKSIWLTTSMWPGNTCASRARPASVIVTVTPRSSSCGRSARDQSRLLQQACLVGQAAAAVDDAVGQVGHAVAARRRVAEAGQKLELHVAEVAGVAQLLLDRVAQQAGHLDQREVRAELGGVERPRCVGHRPILLASNSKQCYGDRRCFEFEAPDSRQLHQERGFP